MTLDRNELCDILNTTADCGVYLDPEDRFLHLQAEPRGHGMFSVCVTHYMSDPESGPDLEETDILFEGLIDSFGGCVVMP